MTHPERFDALDFVIHYATELAFLGFLTVTVWLWWFYGRFNDE